MAIANAVNAQTAGIQSLTSAGVWNGRTITAGTGISVSNGDGVSGNPTISTSGGSGGLTTAYVYDDFIGANSSTTYGNGNTSMFYAVGGSGNSLTNPTSADHPGVMQINSTGASGVIVFGAIPVIISGGGTITCQWICQLPTLSNGTNRYVAYIGLMNFTGGTPAAGAPTKGCWFQYSDNVNSGNWTINSAGAATTTANTSTAADTSWHNFKIIINAANTSVSFYIDNVQVANSPIATNLPNAAFAQQIKIDRTLSGGGSLAADLYILQVDLTNARPS